MGCKLIYDPEMIVWHHRRRTLSSFTKQLFLYGRGRASVFLNYPGSLPFTYFCVAALTAGTVLSIPLYITVGLLQPIITYGWICYFAFLLVASSFISIKNKSAVFVVLFPALAFIEHFTLGLGFISGLIRPFKEVH